MRLDRLSMLAKTSSALLGAVLWCAPMAFGQSQPGGGAPGGGTPGGSGSTGGGRSGSTDEERRQRYDQFRQQMDTRMKDMLKATDDEWSILKPRIEKIQQLQRDADTRRLAFSMMMAGNTSWRTRGSDAGSGQRNTSGSGSGSTSGSSRRPSGFFGGSSSGSTSESPVYAKTQELQTAMESKDPSPDALKVKLAELRAAKEQSKQEITKLQDELRGLCSVRQESALVILGVLE